MCGDLKLGPIFEIERRPICHTFEHTSEEVWNPAMRVPVEFQHSSLRPQGLAVARNRCCHSERNASTGFTDNPRSTGL